MLVNEDSMLYNTSCFLFPISNCLNLFCFRTPAWFKKILSPLKKSENGPVFRFFMDLNDAGTCCIDVTKHFLCFSALLDAL